MGKFSIFCNIALSLLLAGSTAFGVVTSNKLTKTNLENEDLKQTNITINTENTNLKESLANYLAEQKTLQDALNLANTRLAEVESELATSNANIETLTSEKATLETQIVSLNASIETLNARILELENQLAQYQNASTTYTLDNSVARISLLYDKTYTEEEARVRMNEIKAEWDSGERIYQGFNFEEAETTFGDNGASPDSDLIRVQLFKSVENEFIYVYYLTDIDSGFTSNSDYFECFTIADYTNTINILDNFNYEVGQNYSPFEVPSYLDTLDFECIEKTDTYVKLTRKAYTGDNIFIAPEYAESVSLNDILEITKTEDGYSIVFTSSCGLGTITNVITLN